jgi:hypothetical protein
MPIRKYVRNEPVLDHILDNIAGVVETHRLLDIAVSAGFITFSNNFSICKMRINNDWHCTQTRYSAKILDNFRRIIARELLAYNNQVRLLIFVFAIYVLAISS